MAVPAGVDLSHCKVAPNMNTFSITAEGEGVIMVQKPAFYSIIGWHVFFYVQRDLALQSDTC
ncbi:hypothetical protein [Anaplasma marginale]|uniref:hypothetical protein n=1 Tax=Anaplasma marginale TaxID=770 RepID=UPI0005B4732E|nr:hypothetical protein [Anaplasma marginale]